ncbi:hypothetical protein [Mycoplasma sp. Mirounga ES2805-ORL]|uniref:hypothetical protein n=1 Tax=Mycoplasma sp. Mirounga ES2805-ORL TaxID=754514 RepID=UPI00197B3409|nr:hypothetical protein [Mycoplasma sp. Mirounga ES2805-ORL]QSF13497.1 hypothetical protein JXZ90_02360 [Mycoplasma sp. Mirounga ES2805-ORL]
MITIDFETTPNTSYITIKNSISKKADIKVDLNDTTDWNKQNINKFLIELVNSGENKLNLEVTDAAKNKQKELAALDFIVQLFDSFVKKYNN